MRAVLDLLPGTPRVLELHAAELPQKDELCGAFWGALMLQLTGANVDQDAVALRAGTLVSAEPRDEDRPTGAPPRRDFRLKLPLAGAAGEPGTSATGVARAVSELSAGAVSVVPVAGPWSEDTLDALFAAAQVAGEQASLVANVGTRFLWPSHPGPGDVARYLATGDDGGLAPDWDVGHFVGLLGTLCGERGNAVLVADTYPVLGARGVHVQPVPRLLEALRRPGQNAGGVLLALPAEAAAAAERRLSEAGLAVQLWDNGSLDAVAA